MELKSAALSSFRMLIRPVVSLMLRCGVSFREVSEVLRLVFVSVATDEYGKHGRPANVSRVAILTNMSRREVRRARELLEHDADDAIDSLRQMSRATRILSGWYMDPEYVDAKGRPRLLSFDGPNGLEGLLRRYAPDIPPTAMFKELKRVGAIRETPSGKLRPVARTFIPGPLDPEAVLRVGEVVGDLTRTISHNLDESEESARFERRATSRRIARLSRRAFDRYLEERGMEFLEDVDAWLADHESDDSSKRRIRLGVGVYLISED